MHLANRHSPNVETTPQSWQLTCYNLLCISKWARHIVKEGEVLWRPDKPPPCCRKGCRCCCRPSSPHAASLLGPQSQMEVLLLLEAAAGPPHALPLPCGLPVYGLSAAAAASCHELSAGSTTSQLTAEHPAGLPLLPQAFQNSTDTGGAQGVVAASHPPLVPPSWSSQ